MAGILSRVMGYTPVANNVGVENATPTNVIKETEYSFFLLLSDEQIQSVLAKYEKNDFEIFLEGKLPGNDSLRPRIRQWLDSAGNFKSASLETKVPVGDSKEEYPDDICQMNFRALAMACDSMTSRVRIHIPIAKPDGTPYLKKDGSQMGWELDMFYNPVFDGSINNWVKVELEVDALTVADMDIINVIPFEYERLINSKSQDPEDRRIIGDLYSTGYNIATNRNANYESVPTVRSVGTEEFFSFSIPGNEDFDLKNIAIATILISLFAALAAWIGNKLKGGSSGGSGGGGGSSAPTITVKLDTSIERMREAKPAAVKAVPAAKVSAKKVDDVAPVVTTPSKPASSANPTPPLAQRTEEAIEVGIKKKEPEAHPLSRAKIRLIEELKGYFSFKQSWGEPGPCTLHLLLDEINPTPSYYDFLDVATASLKLERAIRNNATGFQYASFMTRAGVMLKNATLIEQVYDPKIARQQIQIMKESLAVMANKLPPYLNDLDAALAGDESISYPDLVSRVTELFDYFDEEKRDKSGYLFLIKDREAEVRISVANKDEMIQSKKDLEDYVDIGSTFENVFDVENLNLVKNELKDGLALANEVCDTLREMAERMETAAQNRHNGSEPTVKTLKDVLGRENLSKHFKLKNGVAMWATTVSYWVSDMMRVNNLTVRVCDAITHGLEKTVKAEKWLETFKDDIPKITDEDVKAYEQKRYVVKE